MNGIVSKAYVHATIALHSGWGNVRSEISADLGYQKSSLAGARARASGPLGACQCLLASANTIRRCVGRSPAPPHSGTAAHGGGGHQQNRDQNFGLPQISGIKSQVWPELVRALVVRSGRANAC
jgi:hypothetical protein